MNWKLEPRNLKLGAEEWKIDNGKWKLETRSFKLQTGNFGLGTRNLKLETGSWNCLFSGGGVLTIASERSKLGSYTLKRDGKG